MRRRPARRARGGQRAGCALGVHEANARPRGTLSSPTRRRRGGPATARRRRAGRGRGAARTGRSTSCVRRRAGRTCAAWRRRAAVSGAERTAVRGEWRRWALGGSRGGRAYRGAVHACTGAGPSRGGSGAAAPAALKVVEGAQQEHLPNVLSARAWPAASRGPPTVQGRARGGEGALAGAAAHHSAPPLLSACGRRSPGASTHSSTDRRSTGRSARHGRRTSGGAPHQTRARRPQDAPSKMRHEHDRASRRAQRGSGGTRSDRGGPEVVRMIVLLLLPKYKFVKKRYFVTRRRNGILRANNTAKCESWRRNISAKFS